ncbi:hypothetical protein CYJ73_24385 [Gordonia terrae]|uniref:Uncharacterized protein n=1 Tax=Gordonia terrae TaxID=2055 RepID=A0A2I1R1E6_9ACTN|nr:hypothetical protein CYJ73_24385 [Gordonia terrae]
MIEPRMFPIAANAPRTASLLNKPSMTSAADHERGHHLGEGDDEQPHEERDRGGDDEHGQP